MLKPYVYPPVSIFTPLYTWRSCNILTVDLGSGFVFLSLVSGQGGRKWFLITGDSLIHAASVYDV